MRFVVRRVVALGIARGRLNIRFGHCTSCLFDNSSVKPCNRIETEIGHKFNVAGDPVDYKYDVKVTSEEAYDRDSAKKTMKKIISEADKISSEIDAAKVNTQVEYTPVFDVNDSFEDVMNTFLSMQEVTE